VGECCLQDETCNPISPGDKIIIYFKKEEVKKLELKKEGHSRGKQG